jgi:GR25 family glycosyltransferase involved in LPS biosynthesis
MSRWIAGLAAGLYLKNPPLRVRHIAENFPEWPDEDVSDQSLHSTGLLGGTWYINEDSEPQRRLASEYWYSKAKIKATRFRAVEIGAADLEPHGWCNPIYKMMAAVHPSLSATSTKTFGIIGCVTSHLAVLGEIQSTGKPGEVYLIAEDDHRIDPSFLDRLPEVLSYVPENWDSIRFDCWWNKEEPLDRCEKVKKGLYRNSIRDCDASNRTHLQDPNCLFCGGTHAMLVRFETVGRLIDLWSGAKGPLLPADCMLTRSDYNNYCLQWNLFHVQNSLETTSKLYTSRLAGTA